MTLLTSPVRKSATLIDEHLLDLGLPLFMLLFGFSEQLNAATGCFNGLIAPLLKRVKGYIAGFRHGKYSVGLLKELRVSSSTY